MRSVYHLLAPSLFPTAPSSPSPAQPLFSGHGTRSMYIVPGPRGSPPAAAQPRSEAASVFPLPLGTSDCKRNDILKYKIIVFRGNSPLSLHFQWETQKIVCHLSCNSQYFKLRVVIIVAVVSSSFSSYLMNESSFSTEHSSFFTSNGPLRVRDARVVPDPSPGLPGEIQP